MTAENREGRALELAEAVPLAYALAMRAAVDAGVRALAIKGPVLERHGLREPQQSVDVDVLVEPSGVSTLGSQLERLGWAVYGVPDSPGIVPLHSIVYRHASWPCEIDLHHWFPGFLADPTIVFDELWRRRTQVSVAHSELDATDVVCSAAIAALHYLRDRHRHASVSGLVDVIRRDWPTDRLDSLAQLAADTGASESLRPLLQGVGAPILSSRQHLEIPLADWTMRSETKSTEVLSWLVVLERTPWRQRPRFIWHGLWMGDQRFPSWDRSTRASRRALMRARLLRLRRGFRALKSALGEYRRLRRK